jgi:ligand-binding SRPBCC domain-containing protein
MLHVLQRQQYLKSDINTVWELMRAPQNLSKITPSYMGFQILSDADDMKIMYPGQIIEYNVAPILGIKINWVTEITHVVDLNYFVDEQRFGPYDFWHHKHFLEEVEGGVLMTDTVHYKLKWGWLGKIAHRLFVKKQLNSIFDYRYNTLEKMYNHGK